MFSSLNKALIAAGDSSVLDVACMSVGLTCALHQEEEDDEGEAPKENEGAGAWFA